MQRHYSVLQSTTPYYSVLNTVLRRPTKYYKVHCAETPWRCKTQCNCDIHNSVCWALKRPLQCAEQFLELKICVSLQFRAIDDPPNPARRFIQQNQHARLATAARNQKFPNARFATAARAKCMKFAFRYNFARSTHRILREGSSSKIKMRVAPTAARNQKFANVRFAAAACAKMYETSERRPRHLAAYKNHRFTTGLEVRRPRSDERVARRREKSAFHPEFDEHEVTKGCAGTQTNLDFTTVLSVRC